MPIGCDFICENKDCQGYQCRISLHGPWPIAHIQAIIDVESDPDRKKALEAKQADGVMYACITIPNRLGIQACGLRLKLYCPSCKAVWDQNYVDLGATATVAEELENPKPCPQCKGKVFSMVRAREDGLDCPICSKPMLAKSWMTSGTEAKKDGNQDSQG